MAGKVKLPSRIRKIGWDMDDSIIRTRGTDKTAKVEVFSPTGLTWEQIAPYSHLSMKELVPKLFSLYAIGLNPDGFIEKYFAVYDRLLAETLEQNELPWVRERIMEACEHGFELALVTSSTLAQANIVCLGLGLDKYFKVKVTAEDITRSKPDPEPYLKAMEKLDVKPFRFGVFEDLPTGIASAKAASPEIFVVAITTTNPPENLRQADIIIDSFDQIIF